MKYLLKWTAIFHKFDRLLTLKVLLLLLAQCPERIDLPMIQKQLWVMIESLLE